MVERPTVARFTKMQRRSNRSFASLEMVVFTNVTSTWSTCSLTSIKLLNFQYVEFALIRRDQSRLCIEVISFGGDNVEFMHINSGLPFLSLILTV